jgi:hypothetical protein
MASIRLLVMPRIFSLGHSTRTIVELSDLLREFGVTCGRVEVHALNPNARVLEDGRLVYREPGSDRGDLFLDAGL